MLDSTTTPGPVVHLTCPISPYLHKLEVYTEVPDYGHNGEKIHNAKASIAFKEMAFRLKDRSSLYLIKPYNKEWEREINSKISELDQQKMLVSFDKTQLEYRKDYYYNNNPLLPDFGYGIDQVVWIPNELVLQSGDNLFVLLNKAIIDHWNNKIALFYYDVACASFDQIPKNLEERKEEVASFLNHVNPALVQEHNKIFMNAIEGAIL